MEEQIETMERLIWPMKEKAAAYVEKRTILNYQLGVLALELADYIPAVDYLSKAAAEGGRLYLKNNAAIILKKAKGLA